MNKFEGKDRRRYARQRMASLAYVELGKDNGGIVLNVGEGGLAIVAATPLVGGVVPQVRFRLPGSDKWIEAGAQITWIGESRKEAGISFVDLAEADRLRIRDWIASLETAAQAAPSSKVPSRLRIVPPPAPAGAPEPETAAEAAGPTQPSDQPSAGLPANSRALPVEAPAPAAPKLETSPVIPSLLGTAEVPKKDAKEDARERAEERSIRVELRLSRRLLTLAMVFLVALLSFLIGTVAGRHSWSELLARFEKPEGAVESSDRPEPAPVNPNSNPSPPLPRSHQPLAQAPPQPSSQASDSSAARAPASSAPAPSAEAPRSETEPAPRVSASTLSREPRSAAPADEQRPSSEAATAVPRSAPSPVPLEQRSNQPPHETPAVAPPFPQTENRGAAPPVARVAAPPRIPAPAEPVAAASPSSPPAAASPAAAPPAPAAQPAAAAASAAAPAATAIGTVAIITNPYPSIRVPPSVRTSRSETPLRLGGLATRIDPVYPPEALRQGVQGVVQLHILIGTDGTVTDTEVVRGPQELIQAARDAVGRWRYQPTFLGTEAVETEADVTATFRLITPASK